MTDCYTTFIEMMAFEPTTYESCFLDSRDNYYIDPNENWLCG